MKKILAILLTLALVLSMAVPALACTPSFKHPDLPQLPEFKFDLGGFWERFWGSHIKPDATEPEPTEAPETKPVGLPAPVITDSRYVHNSPVSRLEIDWNAVEGAERYEVLITRADGETLSFTTESNMVFDGNMKCPRVYIEETSTWASASVQVRALAGDAAGEWSEAAKISCDQLHF